MGGYRVVRPLGQGGMGAVYIAEKLATHQEYAVKFLKEDFVNDPTYRARFEREVGALLAIRHPHVVNVFEWFLPQQGQKGKPFVVMELLDGEGLDQLLRRKRTLPPALAVTVMLQALDGLHAAHAIGVIHRDLGPSNVFLVNTPTGVPLVKILDFGLARPVVPGDETDSNLTSAGTLMGKPGYVAPEMLLEEPLDERSDIFACGMMLFRMLAGRLPFQQTGQQALWAERYAMARGAEEIPGIRNFASWIPPELEAVISKALRRHTKDRYQTVQDMQRDLLAIEQRLRTAGEGRDSVLPVAASTPSAAPGASSSGTTGSPAERTGPSSSAARVSSLPASTTSRPLVRTSSSLVKSGSLGPRRSPAVPIAIAAAIAAVIVGGLLLYLSRGGDEGGRTPAVPEPIEPAAAATADVAPPPPPEPVVVPEPDVVPAALAEPVHPEVVRIVVKGVPDDGTVKVGETVLGKPPFELLVPWGQEPVAIVAEAPNHEAFRTEVIPAADRTVTAEMREKERPTGGGRPGGTRPPRPPRPPPTTQRDAGGTRPTFIEDLPL